MTRPSTVLVVAAALLAGLTLPAVAAPQGAHRVKVAGHLHAVSDAIPDPALCQAEGGQYAIGPTDVAESGTSRYTGTFEGTGRFCGRVLSSPGPGGSVAFVETDTFTGTVRGCGAGTVKYHVTGYVGVVPDASRGGLPTEEDWRVVAGSGTGGLAGLRSGGGHDSGEINTDSSIDTDFKGLVSCAPARSRRVASYDTPVSGLWTVTGCAPTSLPPSAAFPVPLTGVCTGQSQGDWNGLVVDHTVGTMKQDLSLTSQDDIVLTGSAADGSCGSLHIRQRITVAGDTSELKGVATIVGGTGAWAGSTGHYTTLGVFDAGVGEGTFVGVWRRPGRPHATSPVDCRVPLPG